jgi:hypothetical protein
MVADHHTSEDPNDNIPNVLLTAEVFFVHSERFQLKITGKKSVVTGTVRVNVILSVVVIPAGTVSPAVTSGW